MTEPRKFDDFPDYLAAERTFLAWLRTGLALMGFGFVVDRFGLFLRQLEAEHRARHRPDREPFCRAILFPQSYASKNPDMAFANQICR